MVSEYALTYSQESDTCTYSEYGEFTQRSPSKFVNTFQYHPPIQA